VPAKTLLVPQLRLVCRQAIRYNLLVRKAP
jgi:hypothetical protein